MINLKTKLSLKNKLNENKKAPWETADKLKWTCILNKQCNWFILFIYLFIVCCFAVVKKQVVWGKSELGFMRQAVRGNQNRKTKTTSLKAAKMPQRSEGGGLWSWMKNSDNFLWVCLYERHLSHTVIWSVAHIGILILIAGNFLVQWKKRTHTSSCSVMSCRSDWFIFWLY